MKVAILGGGVIGVTSAWYLAEAGHDVVVIDRQKGPALETSFANAGEISAGLAAPWAAPGIPAKAFKWLFSKNAPLILNPRPDLAMLRWLFEAFRNCTLERYEINKRRMIRLAEFSRDRLIELRRETGISYDDRQRGTLQLFRDAKQLDDIGRDISILKAEGVAFELLDPTACVAVEPGLAHARAGLAGGLHLPGDETGDCFKFANALSAMAKSKGVQFVPDCTIECLVQIGGKIDRVYTDLGDIVADKYLVALGSYSPAMLAPLGIRPPIYPVKGYSITVPIGNETFAPVSTVIDESAKVAITRLGSRIRVGGIAEIGGYNRKLFAERRKTLEKCVGSLFPRAANLSHVDFWCGLRPMTPDGTPIIGATPISNLFLNTGHGTLGWTMACGSGHIIADLIAGGAPAIDAGHLAVGRYR